MRRKKTRLNKHSKGGVILTQEEEIVKKILLKDFSGLELLIETYSNHVHQTFLTFFSASDMSQIGDLENQLYFKVWEQIALFNPEKASLKTWCLTITRHLAVDKKRQVIRQLREVPSEILPEALAWQEPLGKEDFLALVAILSPEDQLIFLKFFFFQFSDNSI